MSNFLDFIEDDIQAKKTLLATMPTNTKTNVRKFNEKIEVETKKYEEYKKAVNKYITVKSESFNIIVDKNNNIDNLTKELKELEHTKFILNPLNSYFEKIGFDSLFYQIRNYQDLKFNCLNDIIHEFLNKFDNAGVKITEKDFDYTFYVNKFMSSFLDLRKTNKKSYDKMTEIFEKIYWVNPELVQHIELNFRKLIKKNEKKFKDYVVKKQQKIISEQKIDYKKCLEKLKTVYVDLEEVERENISDIINLAVSGEIDINNYFEDSKLRTSTYNDLMIDAIDFKDENKMNKFYENIEKLKLNLYEYQNFMKFLPLIEDFKKEYFSSKTQDVNSSDKVKELEILISKNEKKLQKTNKKILNENKFFPIKDRAIRELKFDSFKMANELCENYKEYEKENFKAKVFSIISTNFTVPDLLHLYYSFDYFKKMAFKRTLGITNYDEIMEQSETFDLFSMNPTNLIIKGITLNDDHNIARTIVNKYRLVNIDITEEDLSADVSTLIDKIDMLLRINEINKSKTSIENIWFMTQVAKFKEKED